MKIFLRHAARFLGLIGIQVLILNQIEIGFGIQIMVYPLFVLMLPVETGIFTIFLLAFGMGMIIDSMSNTYGMHTSALLVFAYLRPTIFKLFAPRDGYDPLLEPNLFDMGQKWFVRTFGLLLLIHFFWFFTLELFKLSELLYILQKTALSLLVSFVMCVLLQYLFIRNRRKNAV